MSEDVLTHKQYKLLAAHLCHWGRGLAEAREDIGIDPALSDEDVLWHIERCGYVYDRKTGRAQWFEDGEGRP